MLVNVGIFRLAEAGGGATSKGGLNLIGISEGAPVFNMSFCSCSGA